MVQPRSRNKDHLKFCKLYSIDKMSQNATRMQFLAWILQVQTTHRSSRCGGKGHVYARDPLIQMRPDHTGNQMCTVDQ